MFLQTNRLTNTLNNNFNRSAGLTITIMCLLSLISCQSVPPSHGMGAFSRHDHMNTPTWDPVKPGDFIPPTSMNLKDMPDFDQVIFELARKQVIFIGESHDRIEHHLNQLEIIKRIHAEHPKIAIGMEFFQQPFQIYMDQYINDEIDEREFLRKTEYFIRWRIDYRHYRPIIQFAKDNGIPLIALDVLQEIQRKVGKDGIDSLNKQDKKHLPDSIDRSNKDYSDFLKSIYNRHPRSDGQTFEKFVDVQLMRDEAMAQRTTEYMDKNPDRRMIVLAGGGHLVFGYGIPDRVARRQVNPNNAIVLNNFLSKPEKGLADFVLLPEPLKLPKAGLLGIIMDEDEDKGIIIKEFAKTSAAKDAGAKVKDQITGIDKQDISFMADIKFALLDKKPGDTVNLRIKRKAWVGESKEISINVTLQ